MKVQVLLVLLLSLIVAQAQDKKVLSLEDVSLSSAVYPQGLSRLTWIKGSASYSYLDREIGIIIKSAKGKEIKRLTLEDFTNSSSSMEFASIPLITWLSPSTFSFKKDGAIYQGTIGAKLSIIKLIEYDKSAANMEYIHTTKNMSYTKENDLYVNGKKINDSQEGFVYGQAVHRYEFGISKGTFWSGDGKKVAFYKNDQRQVSDYPMINIAPKVAEHVSVKYPMAGQTSEIVALGIYNATDGKTIYIKNENPGDYLTNITWGPAGKYLYIAVLNRDQNHAKWQKYSTSDGSLVKTLLEEKSEKFVEPLHPLYFNPARPNEFLLTSWRDGFTHLYRYNTDGKLLNQVTKGDFEVTGFEGYDAKGKYVYYTSTKESPLENHLYQSTIWGSKEKQLTEGKGQHRISMNSENSYFLDYYSSRHVPSKISMLSSSGKVQHLVHEAANPLADFEENGIEFGTIKANDKETDLYYRIIKPYNFDPSKKYPVIQYVYGGPHAQMIKETWLGGASMFLHYMAQQGFIVFTIDNRGSDNRGADFEQATFRQLGTLEMEDQLTGLEFIKSKNYVDKNRLGVHGWSFGGFMTTGLMLREPGAFKVGVCGGPVIDWKYYEIMYTERYMDTPESNPEGFEKANLLNYVENLEGKLMIVHGADDDVVVWQHTLSFIDACMDKAVLFDYFPYPGHKHHVRGKDRLHLQKNMAAYFIEHL